MVGWLVERKEMKKSKLKEPDVDERFYTGSEFFSYTFYSSFNDNQIVYLKEDYMMSKVKNLVLANVVGFGIGYAIQSCRVLYLRYKLKKNRKANEELCKRALAIALSQSSLFAD